MSLKEKVIQNLHDNSEKPGQRKRLLSRGLSTISIGSSIDTIAVVGGLYKFHTNEHTITNLSEYLPYIGVGLLGFTVTMIGYVLTGFAYNRAEAKLEFREQAISDFNKDRIVEIDLTREGHN